MWVDEKLVSGCKQTLTVSNKSKSKSKAGCVWSTKWTRRHRMNLKLGVCESTGTSD